MEMNPVKGTHDIVGGEADEFRYVSDVFKAVSELYGYKEIIPPVLEYTEVFSRGTGASSDIVRKEMYTFMDKGDRSVTMRPEFTAGVMRAIVSNKLYASGDYPLKLYYYGPAFRYERPQLGRYRQFNQFGVEAVGQDSARLDAETILLAVQGFMMLGFKNVSLKVNSLGDDASRLAYRKALQDYFSSHIDEMCDDCHERLKLNPMRILDCKVEHDQEIAKNAPKMKDFLSDVSDKRFYETLSILNDLGVKYEIDESLVRGLDYYSEIVFEVHAVSPEGKDYGALCGGGHYGGLVKEFGGPDLPGVGFAVGMDRVVALMEDERLFDGIESGLDIYVMPIGNDVLDDCFSLTEQIRSLGYSAEMPLEGGKMGADFKKALTRKAKFALIIGTDEINKGVAQLKNLATQTQKEISLEKLEDELDLAFDEHPEDHADHCDK
jgi:histidyl-tRNA synthetase